MMDVFNIRQKKTYFFNSEKLLSYIQQWNFTKHYLSVYLGNR